jgi:uncharacterized protein YecE (DUF72 family)
MPKSAATSRAPVVLVGTSGFSYPAWRGRFYPADLPASKMLAHYARVLDTVEINLTFHRFPTKQLLTNWKRGTPTGFRFALKAPQQITHRQRLKESGDTVRAFAEVSSTLGTQRGPVLFQMPPNLKADVPRLEAFLAEIPKGVDATFEFRHESWFTDATYEALSTRGAALCIADSETLTTPFEPTAKFGYLRLRREDYDAAAIAAWAEKIRGVARWHRTYVYFKHEDAARGPAYALELRTHFPR